MQDFHNSFPVLVLLVHIPLFLYQLPAYSSSVSGVIQYTIRGRLLQICLLIALNTSLLAHLICSWALGFGSKATPEGPPAAPSLLLSTTFFFGLN